MNNKVVIILISGLTILCLSFLIWKNYTIPSNTTGSSNETEKFEKSEVIQDVFVNEKYGVTIPLPKGWNWEFDPLTSENEKLYISDKKLHFTKPSPVPANTKIMAEFHMRDSDWNYIVNEREGVKIKDKDGYELSINVPDTQKINSKITIIKLPDMGYVTFSSVPFDMGFGEYTKDDRLEAYSSIIQDMSFL